MVSEYHTVSIMPGEYIKYMGMGMGEVFDKGGTVPVFLSRI